MPPLELSHAVFTQMSMRPKSSTVASPSARTKAGSMSATTVAAPASASRSAVACPMPLPPPVTTATRPSSDHSWERAVSVKSGIMSGPPWLDGDADRVGAGNVSRECADGVLHLVETEGVGVRLGDQVAVAFDEAAGPLEARVVGRHRADDGHSLVDQLVGDQAGDRLAALEPDQHDAPVLADGLDRVGHRLGRHRRGLNDHVRAGAAGHVAD